MEHWVIRSSAGSALLALLARSAALICSLARSGALIPSLARSLTPELMGKKFLLALISLINNHCSLALALCLVVVCALSSN